MISPQYRSGFTLIEVLVVVVLVAIVMATVVGSYTGSNTEYEIEGYVQRLALRIEMGRDRAVQTNHEWGVYVEREGVSFAEFDPINQEWLPITHKPFAGEGNPHDLRFTAKVEAYAALSADDEDLPDIILFSSGETTPFEIRMENQADRTAAWRVHSDGFTRSAAERTESI